ncbi:MAG TPA: hypothetical protein VHV47_05175 [Opitutaceae bacterium]|jgi:hypothetical protein|nr:hypothetical protein [Opitutaceae bacterium]
MEGEIKESLKLLMDAIKRSDGAVVTAEMTRLDGILERERSRLAPQLAHFLERRSYAKALMLLGGDPDVPAGACGGRPGGK